MLRSGRAVVRVVAFVAAGVAALSAPAFARAYGWPVKPFDRQHAIRGAFDDPRLGGSFHFGVDISVHDHTAVYAVAAGTVFRYSDAIAVRQRGGREFSYWHVRATVPEHAYVRAGDRIGYVRFGFGHVHFAEFNGKTYVNPLRPGALAPFSDTTVPVVGPLDVLEQNGEFQATVEAYDPPPIAPPPPWQSAVWTPALIRSCRTARRSSPGRWRSTRARTTRGADSPTSSRLEPTRTFPASPDASSSGSRTASISPTATMRSRFRRPTRAGTRAPPRMRSTSSPIRA